MDSIKFGSNYNNKFSNNSFIAVRKSNSIYKVGTKFIIEVRSVKDNKTFLNFGIAKIIHIGKIEFSELTETQSYLDMDLPLREYQSLLIKTYRNFGINIKKSSLDILLLKYENELENNI